MAAFQGMNTSIPMANALDNFRANKSVLDAQSGLPTGATQPTTQTIQPYQQGAFMGHRDYQNKLANEENQATILAKQMRDAEAKATAGATTSAAQAKRHAEQLKAMGANKIVAKHPLDLLAIGIQGWKMRKQNKKMDESTAQAATQAQAAAQAGAQAEMASKRAEILYKHRLENTEPVTPTEQTQLAAYNMALAAGQPFEAMTEEAQAGKFVADRKLKTSREQGTAGQVVDLPAGVETPMLSEFFATETGRKQLIEGVEKYTPEFQGAEGMVRGAFGNVLDFFGQGGEAVEFSADQREFRQGLWSYANKLIKARSGAAVTQQEFERFMREFPIDPKLGARNFEVAMDAYITQMSADNFKKMRQGGWVKNEYGQLVEQDGAPPMKTGDVSDDNFWNEYNSQREYLPSELYNNEGTFVGFSRRGDAVRGGKARQVEQEISGNQPENQPNALQAQAQAALDANKGNPQVQQQIIDEAARQGIKLDALK
jgi:hypothetical protein